MHFNKTYLWREPYNNIYIAAAADHTPVDVDPDTQA